MPALDAKATQFFLQIHIDPLEDGSWEGRITSSLYPGKFKSVVSPNIDAVYAAVYLQLHEFHKERSLMENYEEFNNEVPTRKY